MEAMPCAGARSRIPRPIRGELEKWPLILEMIHEPEETNIVQAIVRDLWALRLQTFTLRINESAEDEDGDESEREVFSSQAGDTDESEDLGFKVGQRYLQWPRLLDSVALCYLAALLMRLPICVSDFYQYVSATSVIWRLGYCSFRLNENDLTPFFSFPA